VHAARHPFLRRAHRMHPHWRVPRSGLVHEALLAAVLEQKVTGQEAWAGWRSLLRRFGDPAPGPGEVMGLRVLPAPEVVCRIPSWEWLRMPVDPARFAGRYRRVEAGGLARADAVAARTGCRAGAVLGAGRRSVDCGRGATAGSR
jgi:3-methyladenine DNA glycosylase/8-oxoguanine DNA glycosylase